MKNTPTTRAGIKDPEQAGAELGQAQLKLGFIELEFDFV